MPPETTNHPTTADDRPPFRYGAGLANEIEARWQDRWALDGVYHAPNPVGELANDSADLVDRPKLYVLDMFPYPSGTGLHVGHPLGYIGTDVFARFKRMTGFNVLHVMGYDAFGLPAEQFAVQTGQHPRVTTEANIATMRRQFRAMGLGHDDRRSVATTDVAFYRWTQWIFLQLFNAWFDEELGRARPIDALVDEFEAGQRLVVDDDHPDGRTWSSLSRLEQRAVIDANRLAYLDEAAVNWCPGLGTVLANEEVTPDGRSERGNFPVFKRNLEQWKLRITAYAERLVDDLDLIDWPEPIKLMQRNWIGRSEGARVTFVVAGRPDLAVEVFTTRPDTLFGATYMVLAPEHPLVDALTTSSWPHGTPASWKGAGLTSVAGVPSGGWATPRAAVDGYRAHSSQRSDLDRQIEAREKTGVFTGSFAVNPTNGDAIPVFIADYVLMGYGTGAIMAVPAHDTRDFEFASAFDLDVVGVVAPPDEWFAEHDLVSGAPAHLWPEAFTGVGSATNSANGEIELDGLSTPEAIAAISAWLRESATGDIAVTYKLRDWLFSRQRYWGEPFPIVYDQDGLPVALPESMLPVELPDVDDYAPTVVDDDDQSMPAPPLARADHWASVTLDLGDGPAPYRRELNTMPQWAGSCWYYLRYLDPTNDVAFVDPQVEAYWMQGTHSDGTPAFGGVDLYVGGVEHAVLHLLYARFWHKVLFDLGHVSTPEPFQRLYNQGYILAPAYKDTRGFYVEAVSVTGDETSGFVDADGNPVFRESGKMGKSLKNAVSPEEIYDTYGADTLRLYEMAMGPLDADRPWNTRDIIGVHRFLQRVWRNLVDEVTGELRVVDDAPSDELARLLHHTIDGVSDDMEGLRFNTAVAKLIELNNALGRVVGDLGGTPSVVADALVRMLSPLAPHIAEELWARMGHDESVVWAPYPSADPALLVADTVEIPVQVDGKVRARLSLPAGLPPEEVEAAALADEAVRAAIGDAEVAKVVVVPDRIVNIVIR